VHLVLLAEGGLLEAVVEPLALGDVERGAEALVVGAEAHEAADHRLVGAVPLAVRANEPCSSMRARSGVPPTRPRARRPRRHAPAVCDDDGPTITGPMMSRRETTGGAGNGRMDGRRR
jgi:hypothetical protein